MNFVAVFMSVFSVIGALDRIFGNRLGLGEKFEKGFMLLGTMALSMIGMIVISPLVASSLRPLFDAVKNVFGIDPSVIPAILFANDMGGAPLAVEVAANADIGLFNALVVSSMMGATFSFTLPYAMGVVKKEYHKDMFFGFLCGIVTIPLGCIISGLVLKLPVSLLLINTLPIVLVSLIVVLGLIYIPNACIKAFSYFGAFIKIVITVGLTLGIIKFLTGVELVKGLEELSIGADVCVNASVVMSGAFTFVEILSRILSGPVRFLGKKLGVNDNSALGFISTLATNATTFEMMNTMDKKGIVMNSAFAVSAAFTFAGHLAFTMAFDADYIFPVIIGKIVSGATALVVSNLFYKRILNKRKEV